MLPCGILKKPDTSSKAVENINNRMAVGGDGLGVVAVVLLSQVDWWFLGLCVGLGVWVVD